MSTIKIRELINKIINYEDVPYEVKYNGYLFDDVEIIEENKI